MTFYRKAAGAGIIALAYQLHFPGNGAREFFIAMLIYAGLLLLVPAKATKEPGHG